MSNESNSDTETPYEDPISLTEDSSIRDVQHGRAYAGYVNNVLDYGIFITLCEKNMGDDITGLVHVKNLPPMTTLSDYSYGEKVIVELNKRKTDGDLELNGLKAPNLAPDAPANHVSEEKPNDHSIDQAIDRIEKLETTINELTATDESSIPQGESPRNIERFEDPLSDALQMLTYCKENDFTTEEYETSMRDSGDTIKVSITLSHDK